MLTYSSSYYFTRGFFHPRHLAFSTICGVCVYVSLWTRGMEIMYRNRKWLMDKDCTQEPRMHSGVGRWAIARKGRVLTPSQTQKADRHQVYHRETPSLPQKGRNNGRKQWRTWWSWTGKRKGTKRATRGPQHEAWERSRDNQEDGEGGKKKFVWLISDMTHVILDLHICTQLANNLSCPTHSCPNFLRS
jgi:hypothetical protein